MAAEEAALERAAAKEEECAALRGQLAEQLEDVAERVGRRGGMGWGSSCGCTKLYIGQGVQQ